MSDTDTAVIVVDWSSDEPVYAQIARQIRARIIAGGLRIGAVLPSVRSIASDLGVNLNTVARAYRMLEEEGFIEIRDRAGATVAPRARNVEAEIVERLTEDLGVILARMRQAGVSNSELRRRVEREIAGFEAQREKN